MNKRSTKFYRKNEAEVMERLELKPTKNSGAGWIEKEDGQSNTHICQLKSTDAQSISVKQSDINILLRNARISHKIPVFAIQFLNNDDVWVAMQEDEYKEYLRLKQEEKERKQLLKKTSPILEKCLDNQENKGYNDNVSKERIIKNIIARKEQEEKRQIEREQRENEYKQKLKDARNRRKRKD